MCVLVEDRLDQLVRNLECVSLQTVADDAFPRDVGAGIPLAQGLGVVDFADVEVSVTKRRPGGANAAVGADLVRRTFDEQEELAPGGHRSPGRDGEFADLVGVEHAGQVADDGVGFANRVPVEQQVLGGDANAQRCRQDRRVGQLRQPAKRRVDAWMAVRVERDRPGRRLEYAGEFRKTHRVSGECRLRH